jgi:hypothetical protein
MERLEPWQHRLPDLPAPLDSVEQHERLTGAGSVVVPGIAPGGKRHHAIMSVPDRLDQPDQLTLWGSVQAQAQTVRAVSTLQRA